jgi:hypothetical protein
MFCRSRERRGAGPRRLERRELPEAVQHGEKLWRRGKFNGADTVLGTQLLELLVEAPAGLVRERVSFAVAEDNAKERINKAIKASIARAHRRAFCYIVLHF